jgi:hypothetical protein
MNATDGLKIAVVIVVVGVRLKALLSSLVAVVVVAVLSVAADADTARCDYPAKLFVVLQHALRLLQQF